MIRERKVTRYQAWCVLCPWTGTSAPRAQTAEREYATHWKFFHGPDATGHKWNGHSHLTMGRWVDECVCGGTFAIAAGSNQRGDCSNARRFGFAAHPGGETNGR